MAAIDEYAAIVIKEALPYPSWDCDEPGVQGVLDYVVNLSVALKKAGDNETPEWDRG